MAGKVSAETKEAVRLVQGGTPVFKAALKAGIYPSTLYAALKRMGIAVQSKGSKESA